MINVNKIHAQLQVFTYDGHLMWLCRLSHNFNSNNNNNNNNKSICLAPWGPNMQRCWVLWCITQHWNLLTLPNSNGKVAVIGRQTWMCLRQD